MGLKSYPTGGDELITFIHEKVDSIAVFKFLKVFKSKVELGALHDSSRR